MLQLTLKKSEKFSKKLQNIKIVKNSEIYIKILKNYAKDSKQKILSKIFTRISLLLYNLFMCIRSENARIFSKQINKSRGLFRVYN